MNGSPLFAGRAIGSTLLTAGVALPPKVDSCGATPPSTGASAGICELRRLTESLLGTRPGDRLLVNLLRLRVYGLFTISIQVNSMTRVYSHAFYIRLGAVGARAVGRQITSHLGTNVSQLGDYLVARRILWRSHGSPTIALEVTYLSLVADDARTRHGGDRMVGRWQSVGSKAEVSLLLRDVNPNFLLPLGELVVFAMLSISTMSTLHYGGYTFDID